MVTQVLGVSCASTEAVLNRNENYGEGWKVVGRRFAAY